jgi:hypothetical protein
MSFDVHTERQKRLINKDIIMLRPIIRAALTALLIPIASSFALAQPSATAAKSSILRGSTHYTIFSSRALVAAVTPSLDVEHAGAAPTSH